MPTRQKPTTIAAASTLGRRAGQWGSKAPSRPAPAGRARAGGACTKYCGNPREPLIAIERIAAAIHARAIQVVVFLTVCMRTSEPRPPRNQSPSMYARFTGIDATYATACHVLAYVSLEYARL